MQVCLLDWRGGRVYLCLWLGNDVDTLRLFTA